MAKKPAKTYLFKTIANIETIAREQSESLQKVAETVHSINEMAVELVGFAEDMF
ncbi:MAG: hypothetical protein AB1796_15605 [Bacillota bacterium]